MTISQFPPIENDSVNKNIIVPQEDGLIEYFKIMWRRKISILIIFFLITAAALIYNLLALKTFEAHAFLKIGQYNGKPITTLAEMKTLYYSVEYLKKIAQLLNLSDKINVLNIAAKFDINADDKNKTEMILIKGRGRTPEDALKIVDSVIEIIIQQDKEKFQLFEDKSKLDLELLKREQEQTKRDIAQTQQYLSQINSDIKIYQKEIDKRSNVYSEGQGRIVESYINLLSNAKTLRQNKLAEIAQLQLKFTNYDNVFFQYNFEKTLNTGMTEIKIASTLPISHISPNRKQNMKILSFIAIIIAILYAFTAEFIAAQKAQFRFKEIKKSTS